METVMTGSGDPAIVSRPRPQRWRRLGRLLSAMVHATLKRLNPPRREPPPEYYRFPWF